MKSKFFVILNVVLLCAGHPVMGQSVLDKLIFRDGSEQWADIISVQDKQFIIAQVKGEEKVSKIAKEKVAKVVFRDGREEVIPMPKDREKKEKRMRPEAKPKPKRQVPPPQNIKNIGNEVFFMNIGVGVPFSGLSLYKVPPIGGYAGLRICDVGANSFLTMGAGGEYAKMAFGSSGLYASISLLDVEAIIGLHHFLRPRLDLNIHAGVGYEKSQIAVSGDPSISGSGLSYSAFAGIAYYFVSSVAFSLETGYSHVSGTGIRLGLSLKF